MSWIPFVCVFAGLVAGILIGRFWAQKSAETSTLDIELHNTKAEFERYKSEVTEHLQSTSDLMHAAQENYEQLTEQLLKTRQLLTDDETQDKEQPVRVKSAGELPPRDYANTSHGLLKQKETSQ
ncbi:hypothetical protein GCM10011369_26570 [Neiella marina]|uniref:Z-ring associated protein G n=1 Tax=Neiella marina TaxID=508461 RepID=A0A8J2XQ51_9GAMM|nr:DUF1043 family protein [Neiella marina]GGA83256.1 hypothetical protein GCM10011369_26570 [Neiella marina]